MSPSIGYVTSPHAGNVSRALTPVDRAKCSANILLILLVPLAVYASIQPAAEHDKYWRRASHGQGGVLYTRWAIRGRVAFLDGGWLLGCVLMRSSGCAVEGTMLDPLTILLDLSLLVLVGLILLGSVLTWAVIRARM